MPRITHAFRLLIGVLTALLLTANAWAVGSPFQGAAFEAAQQAGKPILVTVHADWCPTCRAQEPVITKLLQEPKYRDFAVYRVDFDKQKKVVKRFGAQYQSTLIVFKGAKEVARSTAQTAPEVIAAQLDKAL